METYRQLLQDGVKMLDHAGVPEPDLDAWYLFSECFHMTRTDYFMKQMEPVDKAGQKKEPVWQEFLARRSKREPLQYILGTQEFMGFSFFVSPAVLIPRQDTEILAEKALSFLKDGDALLDMCTGSGCILLSLAKMRKLQRAVGVDISRQALEIAEKNADALNVNAEFYQSDLFQDLNKIEKYDIIVSNPPYVTGREMKELQPEVAEHEPHGALFGGEDGLEFYQRITKLAGQFLKPDGRLLFEIGCRQAEDVKKLMQENGYEKIEIIQDFSGLDRVVAGKYTHTKTRRSS
jgi:release factor glutamine methyltransferase